MKQVMNDARVEPSKPCLQFRYDDDDAIAVDFIAKMRQAADAAMPLLKQHRSVALDWNRGYIAEFGAKGIAAAEVYRPFNVAALGMYVKGNSPLTIMNFNHQKLPQFMPALSFPDPVMYVRSHNGFNDSRQGFVKGVQVEPLSDEDEEVFRSRLAIDVQTVRRTFSGA